MWKIERTKESFAVMTHSNGLWNCLVTKGGKSYPVLQALKNKVPKLELKKARMASPY